MEFIEILKVILIGLVQGVTEWLPISSTGHMILVDQFVVLQASKEFKDMFFVLIQLGSILAVVVLFFYKLNPFSLQKTPRQRKETAILWSKVLVGVLPAGVIGILFDDKINELFYHYQTVTFTLILYGVLFLILEKRNRSTVAKVNHLEDLTYQMAIFIGFFQVLALIPGTSRSGATILGAMLLGCSRYLAAEYSFFLAIPVMFGASALKILKFGFRFTGAEIIALILGMVVAFFVSILVIKGLMTYIKKKDFTFFGYYRIILGGLVLGYFMFLAPK